MTVCIATLFQWNYANKGEPPVYGTAALTASDRMITAADLQYEPQQQKMALFGKSIILVAGDIGIHSQAVADTEREVGGRDLPPHDLAMIYGRAIQAINRRQAENEILAPLGMNTETFHAQQKDLSENFVNTILGQLQNRRPVDTETLVVGSNGEAAEIYLVDAYGNDTRLNGVGFGAIGIGGWHAKSRLMQAGHVSSRLFASTLAVLFAAKKNSEIAPGVGSSTDMHVVLKDGVFPLWGHVPPELQRLYTKYTGELGKLGDALIKEIDEFMQRPQGQEPNDRAIGEGPSRETAQANGSGSPDTAEAARKNDGGKAKSRYA